MHRTAPILLLLAFVYCLADSNDALSWNDERTHRDVTSFAADNSVLSSTHGNFLINLGINKGLDELLTWNGIVNETRVWLQNGAELEDASSPYFPAFGTSRSLNHFHNPLKTWTQAGLDDWLLGHWTGESSLLWAQDGSAQQNIVEGDWSWQKTRDYYYNALTSTTDAARQENFAKAFKGLGHQMHLLQDTSVPDHVRNSAHPEDAFLGKNKFTEGIFFESWARTNTAFINSLAASPVAPNVSLTVPINGYAPITQLYDADVYNGTNPSTVLTQGLSEYTNANFFSNLTIFASEIYQGSDRHYFPYPKRNSTDLQSFIAGSKAYETITAEDGTTDKAYWISKTGDGETINHFLRAGYFANTVYSLFGEGSLYYSTFYRDEKCHEDYAAKLIPRAAGYSTKLIDYFFRGSIDIAVPSNGVYSMIDATQTGYYPSFTAIKLKATNTTTTAENMTDGTIQLVVKYKVAHADPFQGGSVQTDTDFTYKVVPEKNNVSALYSATPTELNFDLSQDAIPLWATDVYLQVVFRGTIGTENNAIAVGFKDTSEPTPIDIFSNFDKICISGSWYDSGSVAAIDQVDANHNHIADSPSEADVYDHDLGILYVKLSPYSRTTITNAQPYLYDFVVAPIPSGTYIRASYILSDYMFDYSIYRKASAKKDTNDHWSHYDYRNGWWRWAIKRQTDYTEDPSKCGGASSCYVDVYPTNSASYPAMGDLVFYTFRGVSLWYPGSITYISNPYPDPDNNTCSYDSL